MELYSHIARNSLKSLQLDTPGGYIFMLQLSAFVLNQPQPKNKKNYTGRGGGGGRKVGARICNTALYLTRVEKNGIKKRIG